MSDKETIQALLWALDTVGIRYSNKCKGFEVAPGQVFSDPVEAAGVRAEYIRSLEVKTKQTLPGILEETISTVKERSKSILPSGITKYQTELKEILDSAQFDMRKALS